MLQRLLSKLTFSAPSASAAASQNKTLARGIGPEPQADPADPLADVPRYPPFDTGIPVKSPEQIVASQAELIGRIFRTAGVSREDFARFYEPIIHALARHHHLLPATATSHHRGAGGLFRMALELGLHALQGANASVFPTGAGVEQRYYLLPKWNLASFIAGVSSQSYRTVSNMIVLDRQNNQWGPLRTPLYDWALSVGADAFFIRWTEDRNQVAAQATSAYLVNQLVSSEALQFLASDNNQVLTMMSSAVTGNPMGAGDNPIAKIIAPVTTRIIEDDLKRSTMNYGHMSIGVHLEPHLIDAMRRLIRTGTWACNHKGMRLWVGTDGTFIEWHPGAQDVFNLLARDAFAGVPRDPDTLADMLCNAGVFERNKGGGKYWTITLPGTAELVETAVKLKHHDLILPSGFDFAALAKVTLTLEAGAAPAAPIVPATAEKPEGREASREEPVVEKPAKIDQETGEVLEDGDTRPAPEAKAAPTSQEDKRHGDARHDRHENRRERQSPPRQEAPPANSPGGAERKPKELSEQAERLLGSLKKESAWLMREILKACANGKLAGQVVAVPQGLGITHDELGAHGQPVMDLIDELQMKGWLWVDKTKPTRKMHMVQVKGRDLRMVILRPDIASGLGFRVETA